MRHLTGIVIAFLALSQSVPSSASSDKCPEEWRNRNDGLKTFVVEDRCYLDLARKLPWGIAKDLCWFFGGQLPETMTRVAVTKIGLGRSFWSGLTDELTENTFFGPLGTNKVTVKKGEPSVFGGVGMRRGEPNGNYRENCLIFTRSGLADYPCKRKFNIYCEAVSGPEKFPTTTACSDTRTSLIPPRGVGLIYGTYNFSTALKKCEDSGRQVAVYPLHIECVKRRINIISKFPNFSKYVTTRTGVWMRSEDWQTAYTHFGSRVDVETGVRRNRILCVKRGFTRQQPKGFVFRTTTTKRCLPGLLIRSPGHIAQYTGTRNFDEAEAICKRAHMSIPDRLSMHCLYDAMQELRKYFPDFAGARYGPYLRNPSPLFMNTNGGQYSTNFSPKNKVLCAEINHVSSACTKANVLLSPPDGVGPRSGTNSLSDALKLCVDSGRNIPVYPTHNDCVKSFIENAKLVSSNSDYVTANTGVWMRSKDGQTAYTHFGSRVVVETGSRRNHVLCVKSGTTRKHHRAFSYSCSNSPKSLYIRSVPGLALDKLVATTETDAVRLCQSAYMDLVEQKLGQCLKAALQSMIRTHPSASFIKSGVLLQGGSYMNMNYQVGTVPQQRQPYMVLCADK